MKTIFYTVNTSIGDAVTRFIKITMWKSIKITKWDSVMSFVNESVKDSVQDSVWSSEGFPVDQRTRELLNEND